MHIVNGQRTSLETPIDKDYSDGLWHYITLTKVGKRLQLDIDDLDSVHVKLEGRTRLQTRQAVQYFGGVPDDYVVLTTNVGSRTRFIGCISDAVINDK